jgi:hypothetical protein
MISVRVVIAAAMMAAAVVPSLAQWSGAPASQNPDEPAQQNSMSEAMVRKVGAALLHVSIIHRDYTQLEQSADSPQRRQELAAQEQQAMEKAVTAEGLSLQQYNQVMLRAQADPMLKQRLTKAADSAAEQH